MQTHDNSKKMKVLNLNFFVMVVKITFLHLNINLRYKLKWLTFILRNLDFIHKNFLIWTKHFTFNLFLEKFMEKLLYVNNCIKAWSLPSLAKRSTSIHECQNSYKNKYEIEFREYKFIVWNITANIFSEISIAI